MATKAGKEGAGGDKALPKLKLGEYAWERKITLASWAGFQRRGGAYGSKSGKGPSTGEVNLSVAATDPEEAEEPGDAPRPEQLAALKSLLANEATVAATVMQGIFEKYPEMQDSYSSPGEENEDMPDLESPEGLKRLIGLGTVHVLWPHQDGEAFVGFEFGCNWDKEHGLGVLTHKGKVVTVGAADTSFDEAEAEFVADGEEEEADPWELMLAGEYARAVPLAEAQVKVREDATNLSQHAQALMCVRRYAEAVKVWERLEDVERPLQTIRAGAANAATGVMEAMMKTLLSASAKDKPQPMQNIMALMGKMRAGAEAAAADKPPATPAAPDVPRARVGEPAVAYWLAGRRAEGMAILKNLVAAKAAGTPPTTYSGWNTGMAAMLVYMAATAGEGLDEAKAMLAKLLEHERAKHWPGPMVKHVLGKKSAADVIKAKFRNGVEAAEAKARANITARRELATTLFIAGLIDRVQGDEAACKTWMGRCAALPFPIEVEWFLARAEAGK